MCVGEQLRYLAVIRNVDPNFIKDDIAESSILNPFILYLSLSMRSASLLSRFPRWEASIVLQGLPSLQTYIIY